MNFLLRCHRFSRVSPKGYLYSHNARIAARYFTISACRQQQDKLKILFFGTDDFAATHLKSLLQEKDQPQSVIDHIELVCPPDRRTGRKLNVITESATKSLAKLHNIPIHHTPPEAKHLNDWTVPGQFDLGVVVSFGYFIPAAVIASFGKGAVNVHPSLLPLYRGAAPIQHTILCGDSETGVTVQELHDKEFDAGRILQQERVALTVDGPPRYTTLVKQLAHVGSHLLVDTLRNFDHHKNHAITQDITKATKAPKIKKEWSEIDFATMQAWQIDQLHRAIGEQSPLRTVFEFEHGKKSGKVKRPLTMQLLNIFLPKHSAMLSMSPRPRSGSFIFDPMSQAIHVMCADGQVVGASHIKAENKGKTTAKEFMNGYTVGDIGRFGTASDEMVAPNTIHPIVKRLKMKPYPQM
ncbi:formyl transferase [Radiomyces spectabilis]|uniref:formyl transferase n=1 Tax=Radiomyces spectabilis TaxID=64574 RepID=UPI00221ED63F|nr:formyl transferase [Radiomyces spectabilis]KAI8370456.1 formyl transferase [Radiomyces spectabilis]